MSNTDFVKQPLLSTILSPLVPTAVLSILSLSPSCPADLLLTWTTPNIKELNGPPDETEYIISLQTDSLTNNVTVQYMEGLNVRHI